MSSHKTSSVRIVPQPPSVSGAGPASVTSPTRASSSEPVTLPVAELDERLREARAGVIVARTSGASSERTLAAAILLHAAETLRESASPLVVLPRVDGAPPAFREIGILLGVEASSTDPVRYGEALAAAAAARPLVAPLPAEGSWDHAVATSLLRSTARTCFFVTSGGRWRGDHELVVDVETLATTWDEARGRDLSPDQAKLSPPAETLLALLALARRPLSRAALAVAEVPLDRCLAELAEHGYLFTTERGDVDVAFGVDVTSVERAAPPTVLAAAARASLASSPSCPWAAARAAELWLLADDADAANAAIARASRQTDDALAAADVRSRWEAALSRLGNDGPAFELRVSAAERALANGEAHEAQRWSESLAQIRPDTADSALLMGRSLLLLGNVAHARSALERALARATESEMRSKVVAVLAEVAYVAGDLEQATALAREAIDLAESAASRLEGRNILGKVHLAAARWEEADAQFAEDAATAAALPDVPRHVELRARLNRAIALMSRGSLDDARVMLESVLEDGRTTGEDRASAFALRNLAVIAYRQHDYGRALSLWDAAVRFPASLCGRITTAFTLANLADLRLRLGLYDHAEHTLAFARRVLGDPPAPATSANLAVVASRLALATGDIGLAVRESDEALRQAGAANDRGDRLPDAYLAAARVALAQSDLTRAAELLATAAGLASNDRLRTEVAIVRVLADRAAGRTGLESATHALETARAADEEDLLSEVHALLAVVHRDAGRASVAREHVSRAIHNRDRLARGLPTEIRGAFLAKPEMVALSELGSALDGVPDDDVGRAVLASADADSPSLTDPVAAIYPIIRRGSVSLHDMKRRIEQGCIARAIGETNGNITRAAALLGMKRPRLSQLVKQYGLLSHGDEDDPGGAGTTTDDTFGEPALATKEPS